MGGGKNDENRRNRVRFSNERGGEFAAEITEGISSKASGSQGPVIKMLGEGGQNSRGISEGRNCSDGKTPAQEENRG